MKDPGHEDPPVEGGYTGFPRIHVKVIPILDWQAQALNVGKAKLPPLTKEEMEEIGGQVREDFATILAEVKEESRQLDEASERRAQAKVTAALYRL